ncbi:DUF3667 domain-containing protein [Chitinophaga rhizophila]|uniref:DUF3667 domain-containing protein n=1 Tax=Chitinophaga rhizophila TaxID=2866212 RepID=A0ABS7GE30_9BACT|nr:DUF3667 domain-containing protein [Chitinophaga rhizophila]MBW8684932.1 DUF3667 domain-containing protein [Chitinophaga rhizophila]
MKTQPLRKETNCLNCGTDVPGRYCTNCGQENIAPHETFGHLVKEFVADIVHYDSKALLTFKYLLTRPGYITKEYIAGKRVKFVHPIKLYIFSSFVFFLLYFALSPAVNQDTLDSNTKAQLAANRDSAKESFDSLPDSVKTGDLKTEDWFRRLYTFETRENYDSFQHTLPEKYRDGTIQRRMAAYYFKATKGVLGTEEERKHAAEVQEELFHHNYPKMMFVLLPLFALYLRWMYDKKKWYYADHAISSIHLHVFFFIFYLLCVALDRLFDTEIVTSIGLFFIFVYLVIALRNTYGQSWGKSLLKASLLILTYLVTLLIVFVGFILTMTVLNP